MNALLECLSSTDQRPCGVALVQYGCFWSSLSLGRERFPAVSSLMSKLGELLKWKFRLHNTSLDLQVAQPLSFISYCLMLYQVSIQPTDGQTLLKRLSLVFPAGHDEEA